MMKTLFSLLLFSVMFLGLPKINYAQGEAAVPFLLLAPDSRAGGIGESGTGLADNSAAIFWNPAGIAFLTGTELSITHSNWLPAFNSRSVLRLSNLQNLCGRYRRKYYG